MKYLSLDEVPDIKRHIIREITKLNVQKWKLNFQVSILIMLKHIKIDHQNETYAVERSHMIYPIGFLISLYKKDGVLSPFLLSMGYNMDPAFLAGYKTGMYNMLQYRGSIATKPYVGFFCIRRQNAIRL
ncbi:MAG: hypothetical protein IPL08_13065 [Saprospiraceae bacterium]|nr:hypothetical protein [Saprospiraceae bacterium]